jgi:hypothetical protein
MFQRSMKPGIFQLSDALARVPVRAQERKYFLNILTILLQHNAARLEFSCKLETRRLYLSLGSHIDLVQLTSINREACFNMIWVKQ